MRELFLIICSLFFCLSFGQDKKYTFYLQLNHYSNAPAFKEQNGLLVYSGKDSNERSFFSQYRILEFYQSFPHSIRESNLSVYTVVTYDHDIMDKLVKEFPSKYLRTEDITDVKYVLCSTYPNDYGATSTVSNLGVPHELRYLDYLNAPKAWDYTYGNSDIIIGISDSNIDTTDVDFKFKTTLLQGYDNYTYNPPYSLDNHSWHGTATAAFAAAQGNNGNGVIGICSECSIHATKHTNQYDGLLELALSGARVINASWATLSTHPITTDQNIIDELYEVYNVIIIASAGNYNPWSENPSTGILYGYPASYNHVISVTSVNHFNDFGDQTEVLPNWGEVSKFVQDMISPTVVTNYQGNGPYGLYSSHTNNDMVDICAPGWNLFQYPWYVLNHPDSYYGSGTSGSAPLVSGSVGLMLSLDACLGVDEVEDILQLTSKNIEPLQGNEPFIGKMGSGKMETGDAVEFVYEMGQTNGNAVIDNHDFYRFDFLLNRVNNKLTISNQKFRDKCTADFTARNIIDILPGSDFKPNSEGFVDLKIDSQISTGCVQGRPLQTKVQTNSEMKELEVSASKLYPNPNSGSFAIQLGKELNGKADIEIYDIYGKLVHKTVANSDIFNVNIDNLSTGVYMVRLSYNGLTETIKFIRD